MASTVWKGQINFGLVSLPVKLHAAARSESVSFNMLHAKDNSRIKQLTYCAAENAPIPRNEIIKGYEFAKDQYVVITDEDIKKVAPQTVHTMEILEFVLESQIDPIYYESSYYVTPDEGGEKPYTLLFETLKQEHYCGVAKLAMHNREHIVILRAGKTGIQVHTMFYQDEVRSTDEFRTNSSLLKQKELEMAKMLVSSMIEDFEPNKYRDEYRVNLLAMIEKKKEGLTITASSSAQTAAPIIDVLEALKQSIEKQKSKKKSSKVKGVGK